MSKTRILIVEDESIIALDLKTRLERMGYVVTAIASKGEDAFSIASEDKPDIVLMDIKLAGKIDGIQTADRMREFFSLPIIYLSAFSDDATLERAKISQPFGYIVKPVTDQDLRSSIEISLHNHKMQQRIEESEQWLTSMLDSISDGVIATSDKIYIRLINPVAEMLTGWNKKDAVGLPIDRVLHLLNPEDNQPISNLIEEISTWHEKDYILVSRQGMQTPIGAKISIIKNDQGIVNGIVAVFDVDY